MFGFLFKKSKSTTPTETTVEVAKPVAKKKKLQNPNAQLRLQFVNNFGVSDKGLVGKITLLKDIHGERLRIGDLVEVTTGKERPNEQPSVCVIVESMLDIRPFGMKKAVFPMGYAPHSHECLNKINLQYRYKKVRHYYELEHGMKATLDSRNQIFALEIDPEIHPEPVEWDNEVIRKTRNDFEIFSPENESVGRVGIRTPNVDSYGVRLYIGDTVKVYDVETNNPVFEGYIGITDDLNHQRKKYQILGFSGRCHSLMMFDIHKFRIELVNEFEYLRNGDSKNGFNIRHATTAVEP